MTCAKASGGSKVKTSCSKDFEDKRDCMKTYEIRLQFRVPCGSSELHAPLGFFHGQVPRDACHRSLRSLRNIETVMGTQAKCRAWRETFGSIG